MDRHVLRRGTLLLLLLLAFALRVSGLTVQSMWRDEVDALRFSQASLADLAKNFSRTGWNGPLFYVLLRVWVHLTGSSEFALRAFSLSSGLLGVSLVYRVGRTWFSNRIGMLAALLTAFSPYMVWYAQEAKMYALLVALVVGTVAVYREALRSGNWRLWVTVTVLAWIIVTVHIMGALLIPTMALMFFAWWPFSRARWRQALLSLAGASLPGFVASPWALPVLVGGGNIGHRFVPLSGMIATMLYAFTRGITNGGGTWATAIAVVALLAGTVLGVTGDTRRWVTAVVRGEKELSTSRDRANRGSHVLAVWMWLVVPVLGLYAVSLRVPMFVDRYLIWIGPAFYLLVARGLDRVWRRSAVFAILGLLAFLCCNAWGVWEQSARPIKSDFRAAAAHVREHRQPGELLLFHISYVRDTFEYYYGESSPAADGVPTDERTTEAAVHAAMWERIAGHEVVWLVLSEPEMWDRRGMTVAWLDAHARAELRVDLERVSVVKYRISNEQGGVP